MTNKNKYGFKNYGDNGLSSLVQNRRYSTPKKVQQNSLSDLFQDYRTPFEKQQQARLDEERAYMDSLKPSKELLMSADEVNRLEIANTLTKLNEKNRYFMVVKKDLSTYKDSEFKIGRKGYYIETYEGETLYLNYDIDQITEVAIPVCCVINPSLRYSAYNLFTKHPSGSLVHKGTICFAN